jgi:hypothetical protein
MAHRRCLCEHARKFHHKTLYILSRYSRTPPFLGDDNNSKHTCNLVNNQYTRKKMRLFGSEKLPQHANGLRGLLPTAKIKEQWAVRQMMGAANPILAYPSYKDIRAGDQFRGAMI